MQKPEAPVQMSIAILLCGPIIMNMKWQLQEFF